MKIIINNPDNIPLELIYSFIREFPYPKNNNGDFVVTTKNIPYGIFLKLTNIGNVIYYFWKKDSEWERLHINKFKKIGTLIGK